MPSERQFIAEHRAAKGRAARPIPVEQGVTAIAEAVGTRMGRGRLRATAGNDRHHDAVKAMARRAMEVPTPVVPTRSPHRLHGRAPRSGPARPLFQAERDQLRMLLGKSPYDLTADEVDIISRLHATTDPTNADRPQREEVAADHGLVDTIYRPLVERFDHEHRFAALEAQAASDARNPPRPTHHRPTRPSGRRGLQGPKPRRLRRLRGAARSPGTRRRP